MRSGERRRIAVRRVDGLGGRLLAIVRAMRFAELVDAEVSMCWPTLAIDGRDAEADDWHVADLFDLEASRLEGVHLEERPLEPRPEGREIIERDETWRTALRFGFEPDELFETHATVYYYGQRTLRLKHETDADVAAGMARTFDRLVPSAPVRASLASIRTVIEPFSYAGLHIRRGDILRDLIGIVRGALPSHDRDTWLRYFAMRCAPLPLMLRSIAEHDPHVPVVVLGDDPSLVAQTRAALGTQAANPLPAPLTLGPIQQALCEILVLREGRAIHGTQSQFSRAAAHFGKARYHTIDAHGDPTPWIVSFEQEVLDAAGVTEADRETLRQAYLSIWTPMAEAEERRQAQARKHAKRAAGLARPA